MTSNQPTAGEGKGEDYTTASASGDTINLDTITRAIELIAKAPKMPIGFTLSPHGYSRFKTMTTEMPSQEGGMLSGMYGTQFYMVPNQQTQCLAFYDARLLRRYLKKMDRMMKKKPTKSP